MVNPMVGWGYKEVFNWLRKFIDVFSMNPELIQYGHLVTDKENEWVEAHQHYRYKENNFNVLGPA